MRYCFIALATLTFTLVPLSTCVSQSEAEESAYIFLVESVERQSSTQIEFRGAYESHDATTSSKLTFIQDKTPFALKVSGTSFLGIFQSLSKNAKIKVTLKKFQNGKMMAQADGSSTFNILYGEPAGIGYGLPTSTISDSRFIDEINQLREHHE